MRAYRNIKLTECPDKGDIGAEGRRSGVGRNDARSNFKNPAVKAAIRRAMKKADRNRGENAPRT